MDIDTLFLARDVVVMVTFALAASLVFNWRVWAHQIYIGTVQVNLRPTQSRAALATILVLAGVVRLIGLTHDALWYDESFTALVAKLPLDELVAATAADVHPPGWYIVEKAFVALLGRSTFALRLPAAILGTLAVWLAWRFLRQVAGEHVAQVGAALLAISPFAIYYSNEARMYALLLTMILIAMVGAIERRPWMIVLGLAGALLSHNLAALYVPVVGVIVWQRCGLKVALITCGLSVAVWGIVWAPVVLGQMGYMNHEGYWIEKSEYYVIGHLLYEVQRVLFGPFFPMQLIPLDSFMAGLLALLPLTAAIRRRDRAGLLLAWVAFAPAAIMLIVSLGWRSMLLARPLIGSLPAWLGLIAWWLLLPRRWDLVRVGVAVMACVIFVVTTCAYYAYDRAPYVEPITQFLHDHLQPDDMVVFIHSGAYVAITASIDDAPACLIGKTIPPFDALTQPCGEWERAWLVTVMGGNTPSWSVRRAEQAIDRYNGKLRFNMEQNMGVASIYELESSRTYTTQGTR